jgi:hypothetical protein
VDVNVQLEAINAVLQRADGSDVALVGLARAAVRVSMTSSDGLVVSGSLSDITVEDCRDAAFHKTIVGVMGEEMLDFSFAIPPLLSPQQQLHQLTVQPNQSLRLRLSSVRVMYVKDWVDELLKVVKSLQSALPKPPSRADAVAADDAPAKPSTTDSPQASEVSVPTCTYFRFMVRKDAWLNELSAARVHSFQVRDNCESPTSRYSQEQSPLATLIGRLGNHICQE